jgi:hypothetical protein
MKIHFLLHDTKQNVSNDADNIFQVMDKIILTDTISKLKKV